MNPKLRALIAEESKQPMRDRDSQPKREYVPKKYNSDAQQQSSEQ
jgi:hypothetical protein